MASRIGSSPFGVVAAAFGRAVASRWELTELLLTSILSGRTEELFDRLVGPMTSPWPVPIPLEPVGLVDAARLVSRTTARLSDLAAYCPGEVATQVVPAFADLPGDTYFSDAAINFTSYARPPSSAQTPQVVEILGPIEHPLLDAADFAPLAFPAGLHLIVDVSGELAVPSLWYHQDRFTSHDAAHLISATGDLLRGLLDSDQRP